MKAILITAMLILFLPQLAYCDEYTSANEPSRKYRDGDYVDAPKPSPHYLSEIEVPPPVATYDTYSNYVPAPAQTAIKVFVISTIDLLNPKKRGKFESSVNNWLKKKTKAVITRTVATDAGFYTITYDYFVEKAPPPK